MRAASTPVIVMMILINQVQYLFRNLINNNLFLGYRYAVRSLKSIAHAAFSITFRHTYTRD